MRSFLILSIVSGFFLLYTAAGFCAAPEDTARINIMLVTDEAEAVLNILEKREKKLEINGEDWSRLFSSEGFTRLKKREESFRRKYEEENFKKFVMSDLEPGKKEILKSTLENWSKADFRECGVKAFAYLPAQAKIKVKIYPVIKPAKNSFVFEAETDPAIFLYLDPEKSRAKFENTVTHELHHIGFASIPKELVKRDTTLPENIRQIIDWIGAFGEGYAMLAAAGGPDIHPHACSVQGARDKWDKDIANFNDDLKNVEDVFLKVLDGKITGEEIEKRGMAFFGEQGAWYTVGWKMAMLIEKSFGRPKLIDCMLDNRQLLIVYNKAVDEYNKTGKDRLATWSDRLVNAISEK